MTTSPTGWPRGRTTWIIGTIVLFAAGILVGMLLGSVWVGLLIAAVLSIGWVMAYESWRGRQVGLYDRDDNGAVL